ncbi:DUF1269 domain-containing protein [Pendulispora albinea]|uniref:DUF1269 domain-containing protein n=1 Tax=Pendulispora albinea TaxID=2741071 RepID=A0ABZ2M2Y3_9BACT
MSSPDPRTLIVLSFDSTLKAQEALLAATRLQTEGAIVLHDAVFVEKHADGTVHVQETVDETPGDAALRSSVWGALIGTLLGGPVGTVLGGAFSAGVGALAAQLSDYGIPNAKVHELRASVNPGNTALALLVSHVREAALVSELSRFSGASLLEATLPPEVTQAVRNALRPKEPSEGSQG